MTTTLPSRLDAQRRRFIVGTEPMVFHCHHYNTFLQRSIQDAVYIESRSYMVGGAAEVAYNQLSTIFRTESVDELPARKELAQDLYRWAGFGTVDFASLDEKGGTIRTPNSHYAMAWKAKFGTHQTPVCLFATGWIAGAAAAIFDKPNGSYEANHTECSVNGRNEECVFTLSEGEPNYAVFESTGEGLCTGEHKPLPLSTSNVDYEGIFSALTSMDIVGDEAGTIPVFGVYLTRHYANYYNRISFETERAMSALFGKDGLDAAQPLFVEAGHVCAFNTFGGIMTSPEWDGLIKPSLQTKDDWVHGMTAAVNALGWGRWQVTNPSEKEATFTIDDDYESVGHLGMYGETDHSVSHLARGAAVGIMNLVYRGDVAAKPEFTPEFYDKLFKGEGNYESEVLQARAMGDAVTSFRVFKP